MSNFKLTKAFAKENPKSLTQPRVREKRRQWDEENCWNEWVIIGEISNGQMHVGWCIDRCFNRCIYRLHWLAQNRIFDWKIISQSYLIDSADRLIDRFQLQPMLQPTASEFEIQIQTTSPIYGNDPTLHKNRFLKTFSS